MSLDLKDHEKFLKGAISIDTKEQMNLRSILNKFCQKNSDQYKLICNYYLIDCTNDDIRENEFIDWISRLIIVYTLKKDEYGHLEVACRF